MSAQVFLGGEGANELGSLARDPVYQPAEPQPGVLETLLRSVQPEGWEVAGAKVWKRIVKYKAKGPVNAEQRNVLGLALEAERANAHALAFLRDTDGDADREEAIQAAIPTAKALCPTLEIIAGTPKPLLEAWLLALKGQTKTEGLSKTQAVKRLAEHVPEKDTAAMVDYVRDARPFAQIAEDAVGLRSWLSEAERVLKAITKLAAVR